jgi:hypothetical protein
MTPARAAWTGAAIGYGLVAVLGWTMFTDTTPDAQRVEDLLVLTALLGTPVAAAAAILGHRLAAAARGHDFAERIVGLATAGIDGPREEWAAAMRAELASIPDKEQRRRFAVGCAGASLRTSIDRTMWLLAVAGGVVVAAATLFASRVSLAGGRGGIMAFTLLPTILVLFGVAFLAAATTRSFRSGLITGALCLIVSLGAWLTVSMVEAAHWYHVAGVYIMDGDVPTGFPLDLQGAILDPLGFVVPHLLLWMPLPVLGAAAGARMTRSKREEATAPASSLV